MASIYTGLRVDSLSIEITRRCNMACAHCLRGDARDMDIKPVWLDRLFSQIEEVGCLTFSGGEPSLNVSAMTFARKICADRKIPVANFYVVTNGKEVPDAFLHECLDWKLFCTDGEISAVALSSDKWHEKIPYRNKDRLQTLGFFTTRDEDLKEERLIRRGHAEAIWSAYNRPYDEIRPSDQWDPYSKEKPILADLVLRCDGTLAADANLPYDDTEHLIGDIRDKDWAQKIAEKLEELKEKAMI